MKTRYKVWLHLEEITTDDEGNEEFKTRDDLILPMDVAEEDTLEDAERVMNDIYNRYYPEPDLPYIQLVENFGNKLSTHLDLQYFPDVKFYRDNADDTDVHYTVELFSNGCLNYSNLIYRLAYSCKDTKANIHNIVQQYIVDNGNDEYLNDF